MVGIRDLIKHILQGVAVGVGFAAALVVLIAIVMNGIDLWSSYVSLLRGYFGRYGAVFGVLSPFFAFLGAWAGFDVWSEENTNSSKNTIEDSK